MKRTLIIAVAAIVSSLTCFAQDRYVASSKGNVNLRTAPSTTASKAGILSPSDLLPLIEEVDAASGNWDEGWYKVDANGKVAYVSRKVADTCDASVPEGLYKRSLTSNRGLDKIRFQGSMEILPYDKTHALINITWMRMNLPAEDYCYIADVKDGKIVATHQKYGYSDESEALADILEAAQALDHPMPVGFNEFNEALIFDGIEYTEDE